MANKNSSLAKLFRDARKASGLKSVEFARALNISYPYLWMIETGKRTPNGKLVLRVVQMKDKYAKLKGK